MLMHASLMHVNVLWEGWLSIGVTTDLLSKFAAGSFLFILLLRAFSDF
ncbi:hypothetical protein WSI_01570 [Candidatus Liberibacter asiaticus str. gxpsy]|uniref:Uncharacterized protein n=2 Tax=Liberibacter asiaticus TaxID=34021 RepID=C6XEW8_LIBAP|nr:hypothetical protein CLIBASIA_01660 [Candidatus Liberibacter asiaticus str. psy62]AGH16684.1 hypothetical protein WSI_01570 [Candidatus Liberibacter asiaticus str. gxpsy]